MTAAAVRVVVHDAVKLTGASPAVVTDNGSQFTAQDFQDLVRECDLEHIRIRTYHPESKGKVARFHRSTRDALEDVDLRNLGRAREVIGGWVRHYNEERLHAALHDLPPNEYYTDDPPARLAERHRKLAAARERRYVANRARLEAAA